LADGLNLYCYASSNPLRHVDPSGTTAKPLPQGGFIGDFERVTQLWNEAAHRVLSPKFGGVTGEESIKIFEDYIRFVEGVVGDKGSNTQKGTPINIARETYKKVRTHFGKLLAEAGSSVPDMVVHHFTKLSEVPAQALDPGNLILTEGQAGVKSSGHGMLHEMERLLRAGVKNPGLVVLNDAGKVIARAGRIVERTMPVLEVGLAVVQIGSGVRQFAEGERALGAIDVAEGSASLGMTLSTSAAVKAGAIAAGSGAAASIAAGGSVALVAETARAAVRGEPTPIDVADRFYGTHFGDIHGWVTGAYRGQ
jgi:hypothetical protein